MTLRQALLTHIAHRAYRSRYLPAHLLGEPGWDLLLDLALARLEHRRISVTSACIGSGAPATTGLRWIALLVDAGLAERKANMGDARSRFVQITDAGMDAVAQCFGLVEARAAA